MVAEDSTTFGSVLASSRTAMIDGVETDFCKGEFSLAFKSRFSASLLETTILKSPCVGKKLSYYFEKVDSEIIFKERAKNQTGQKLWKMK